MPVLIWPLLRVRSPRSNQCGIGPLVANMPMPTQPPIVISGVTRDSTGTPLGNVSLNVFRTDTQQLVQQLTSDGSGNYTTNPVGLGLKYQIDAYLAGSPDVAGTTKNDLTGA